MLSCASRTLILDFGLAFVACSVLLAGPHFPRAGFVQPASTPTILAIFPGEIGSTPLPARLQLGRRRRGDRRLRPHPLPRPSPFTRSPLGSGRRPGCHPGPQTLHTLPGPGGPELGNGAVIIPLQILRNFRSKPLAATDRSPGPFT